MKTISTEKMHDYLGFFEELRQRCENNEPANVRKLGAFMKVSPNLFYAAAELGYFKKLNKSYYQCTIQDWTTIDVNKSIEMSRKWGRVWTANKKIAQKEELAADQKDPGNIAEQPQTSIEKITQLPVQPTPTSVPPVFADVKAFAEMRAAKGYKKIDPLLFHAHYSATGWKIGKNPIKNWKAAFVTWERREIKYDPMSLRLCTKEAFEEEMKSRGYRLTDVHPTEKATITNYIKTGNFMPGEAQEFIDLFSIKDLIAAIKRKGATGEIHYTTTLTEKL